MPKDPSAVVVPTVREVVSLESVFCGASHRFGSTRGESGVGCRVGMLDRVDGGGILRSSSPAEQVLGQSLVLFINHVYTITFNLGEEKGGRGSLVCGILFAPF